MTDLVDSLAGVLFGTAVGDAIGLPREGLSERRAIQLFGEPPLRHRFFLGRGLTSDDTEHTCMAAQALLASHGNPDRFTRSMAWRLRGWLLGFPAGVGMATARAILKLLVGFPPTRSGVWSAGNGPAMRAAILGVYAANDAEQLRLLVCASTRLTHTDPAAEHGARIVAMAAAYGSKEGPAAIRADEFLARVQRDMDGAPIVSLLEAVVQSIQAGRSFSEYLASVGCERGVSGYINHTVPAAIYCWLRWPGDFRAAVEHVVMAGGDADTTGAIVGALVGATAGVGAIPDEWLDGLIEWPRTSEWMQRLARALADAIENKGTSASPIPLFWPGLLPRNLFFLAIVLIHAFRRILPPY